MQPGCYANHQNARTIISVSMRILSTLTTSPCNWLVRVLPFCLIGLWCTQVVAQGIPGPGGVCKPASQRTQEIGCWILADDPMGTLSKSTVFWHLDTYSTRDAAEADKGKRGVVFESLDRVWLMTIEDEHWHSAHGTRIAEIGPLAIIGGVEYSAQYMEAVFTPGMTAPAHLHSGPEAWYTLAGETCLETSDGLVHIGRAGGPAVIVASGLSMHLTATGTEQRQALVLILHETSKAATSSVHDWVPKGLCKQEPVPPGQ